jgi:hypothetical protein
MNAFEPIELDEHDGLLWVEVPTEGERERGGVRRMTNRDASR